jgi:PAS domain S-box-containing protein
MNKNTQDIENTERKNVEVIQQEALTFAESIIGTVREPLIVLDANLKIQNVNKSFYDTFKVNEKETIGTLIYDLGNKQWDIPKLRELLDEVLTKKQDFMNYEMEHHFQQIGQKSMLLNAKRIFRKDTGTETILLAIEDITERKKAEEEIKKYSFELERSNTELEHFAYVASHDLQEPLRMVASYTQLLEKKYSDKLDDNAKKYINFAVDGAVRMQALINDLLDYSRVGANKKEITKIDCKSVINRILTNMKNKIITSNAQVKFDELPEIYGDEVQIERLFQNLISNSIKFHSNKPPIIEIETKEESNNLCLFSFKDNGIGFEKEFSERVFQIFQRLHTKQEYTGTGIGLAVCKKIVETHGGTIWADSEIGKGSTFYFTLPIIHKIHIGYKMTK